MRSRVTFVLAILAVTIASAGVAHTQAARTNIVIIWGDDIGQSNIIAYSHGVMGYKTPTSTGSHGKA